MNSLIASLMVETGLSESDLRRIIHNAPRRYKTYTIEKRSGGRRPISQPALELKVLQRALSRLVLDQLPVHESATAYRHGLSIKDNARIHASNGPILKFDFKNFFPSLRAVDWINYCIKNSIFDEEESVIISQNILFHRAVGTSVLNLAIGAPSSPQLSNILLFEFDQTISRAVTKEQVTYSRYADDLTFSAKRTGYLQHVEWQLKKVLKTMKTPRIALNEDKTVFSTRKYKRVVTGLVITNDGNISIGHEKKKIVRAAVHQALLGKLNEKEMKNIAGYLAFVADVEPSFIQSLVEKYGLDQIKRIRACNKRPNNDEHDSI